MVGLLLFLWLGFMVLDRIYPLPDPNRIDSVIVLAKDDTPLRAFADSQGVWRYPVTLDEVSPLYLEALLGYEDRWFYYHFGINPLALLRAGWQWIEYGRIISGGSTLTMQVARILDLHSRSVPGKLQQMFRALQLEWHYSKDEILTFYLNLAPFGGPIEGVQTASYAYLHKPVKALSHAEAALLAVLPQAPSRLRPDRHPEKARRYRDKLLARMETLGIWSAGVVADARIEAVFKSGFRQPLKAPLFARRIKDAEQYQGQSRIQTALDADFQWAVEDIIHSRLGILPPHASAAVMIMENQTGLVRAYAGSADFFSQQRSGHVDMVQALRSPGSTLKPFLYGLAMDEGLVHSASLLSDVPLRLAGYAPRNFRGDYSGAVTVSRALQESLNVPAVDMLQRVTPVVFDARLQNGGITLTYPEYELPNLSLILGGAGTRLEDLVRGFSAFARSGITIKPRYTMQDATEERRILSPEAGWVINDILSDIEPPTGFSSRGLRLSWKTGTSYGFRDAWSIGVNERYTVGVWTGRPDGTPLPGQFGARASGPLLFEVFQVLPRPRRALKKPPGVSAHKICWPLGSAAEDTKVGQCHQMHQAWVVNEGIPLTLPSLRDRSWSARSKGFWVNPVTGLRVNASCHSEQRVWRSAVQWPFELFPWLSAALIKQMRLPDFDVSCPETLLASTARSLAIESFVDKSIVRLPQAVSRESLELELQAVGGQGGYNWWVDGYPVGRDAEGRGLRHAFSEPGDYELMVTDEASNVDKINIRIVR
ncbi:MAG: Penicillin-insensitive transglycosylase (EC & transpeptidase PBP-1C [uncultured Thiotrichaceae bacterium]|uniref:peptidoglycan glycosyltransferase n=1 Tax=uncultured Thiotrichaceae bacterium TaxID=298394 RepID=A0A6S6T8U0_9GAMM|nr:MAG: Penicillin-insensitive transglycosylase (EC & transpeptidase PBP-1C [uncultured Thiotrichaceae bacterium]